MCWAGDEMREENGRLSGVDEEPAHLLLLLFVLRWAESGDGDIVL